MSEKETAEDLFRSYTELLNSLPLNCEKEKIPALVKDAVIKHIDGWIEELHTMKRYEAGFIQQKIEFYKRVLLEAGRL